MQGPLASLGRRWPALLVAAALLLLLSSALYGLLSPAVFGHYGYHLGEYATRARHTLRSGAVLPYNVPGFHLPGRDALYLHHPILTHHLAALFMALFGDHEGSVRAAATAAALGSLGALAALLNRTDGPARAGAGALLFALVPITLWYASHIDPGLASIAFVLLFFRSYFAFCDTGARRDLLLAVLFLMLSAGFEWSPYLAVAPAGLHALWTAWKKRGRFWLLPAAVAVGLLAPLLAHFAMVHATGHDAEMRASYSSRTVPLDAAFYYGHIRRYCEAYFGRPLLLVLPLWLASAAARAARGRGRRRDLVGFGFLFAVSFYTAWFKDGVLTHGYRLLYGNVAVVIAALGVADDLADAVAWLRFRLCLPALPGWPLRLAPLALLALATAPRSWSGLIESRAHQGIPGWTSLDPRLERSAFARLVRSTARLTDQLYLHPALPLDRMELAFYLDLDQHRGAHPASLLSLPPDERSRALVLFPAAGLSQADRAAVDALSARYPYRQVGPFAWLDLREEGADVRRYSVHPRGAERPLWRRYLEGPYPWPELRPLP